MPSYDNKVLTGDQLVYYSGLIKTALAAKADSSALIGKQDALTIGGTGNTYNASTNPVATLDDIFYGIEDFLADGIQAQNVVTGEDETTGDPITLDTILDDLWSNIFTDIEDPENPGEYLPLSAVVNNVEYMYPIDAQYVVTEVDGQGNETTLDTTLSGINTAISGKQDALVFNTAYNASSNKVATMSDITTALSGISSFSFEIVQSLPQSDISTSKIYLVAKQTSGTNQVYTEYAYVNNGWEIIGDTSMTIDTLSNQEVATIWSTASAT